MSSSHLDELALVRDFISAEVLARHSNTPPAALAQTERQFVDDLESVASSSAPAPLDLSFDSHHNLHSRNHFSLGGGSIYSTPSASVSVPLRSSSSLYRRNKAPRVVADLLQRRCNREPVILSDTTPLQTCAVKMFRRRTKALLLRSSENGSISGST